ncbi:MAG: FAD/NAD(P)-binding protein, partial [Deinococcota bacterium]
MTNLDKTPVDVAPDVAIVGGGLAGLTCAYYLRKQRPEMKLTVLEQHSHPGGNGSGRSLRGRGLAPSRYPNTISFQQL